MQRYAAIFVSVAMMTVAFAGAASADVTNDERAQIEEQLEMRDRYDGQVDWDEVETVTHDFQVPLGATYAFTIDWATGETEVEIVAPMIAGTGVGPNAGCISQVGGDTPWAQPGVAVEDCSEYTSIESSVSSTTVVCATDGEFCSADGLNFDFLDFGAFAVTCGGQAVDQASWGDDGALLFGETCEVFLFGASPTEWDEYDSFCGSTGGASAGIAGCTHSA